MDKSTGGISRISVSSKMTFLCPALIAQKTRKIPCCHPDISDGENGSAHISANPLCNVQAHTATHPSVSSSVRSFAVVSKHRDGKSGLVSVTAKTALHQQGREIAEGMCPPTIAQGGARETTKGGEGCIEAGESCCSKPSALGGH